MPRYGTMVSCRTAATTAPTAASVRLIWRDPRRGAWPLAGDRNKAMTEVAVPAGQVYRPTPNRGNHAHMGEIWVVPVPCPGVRARVLRRPAALCAQNTKRAVWGP